MSVEPGFGGQKFMENSLPKIKFLDDYRKKHKLNYLIEVDGGIMKQPNYAKIMAVILRCVGHMCLKQKTVRKQLRLFWTYDL